jgi:hypothetical protein
MVKLVQSPCAADFGHILVRYASHFAPASLHFSEWFPIVLSAIETNSEAVVFLLAAATPSIVAFASPTNPVTIVLLHFASMLCPTIAEHASYGLALSSLVQ